MNTYQRIEQLLEEKEKHRTPLFMRRCVVDLVDDGEDKNAAFAICRDTMNDAGYYNQDGQVSKKGQSRIAQMRKAADFPSKEKKYDALVGKGEKVESGSLASRLLQSIAEDNDDRAMVVASLKKSIDLLKLVLSDIESGDREMMSWEESKVYGIAKDAQSLLSGMYYDDEDNSDDELDSDDESEYEENATHDCNCTDKSMSGLINQYSKLNKPCGCHG